MNDAKNMLLDLDQSPIRVMDGQHFTVDSEDSLCFNNIDAIPIPPHSSDQVQSLDLCLFSCFKMMIPQQKTHSFLRLVMILCNCFRLCKKHQLLSVLYVHSGEMESSV